MTHRYSAFVTRAPFLAFLAAFALALVGAAPATAAPVISLTASPANLGYVPVGTVAESTITLTNTGDAPLTNISINYAYSSVQITVIPPSTPANPAANLPAGESRAFTVRYAPTTRTSASVSFSVSSSSAPGGPRSVYVGGAGAGAFFPAPSSFYAGGASVGSTYTSNLTVRNYGELPLVISGATLSGANAADFSVDAAAAIATPIPPNGQRNIAVAFSPSAAGPRNASLQIASNSVPAAPSIPIYAQGF